MAATPPRRNSLRLWLMFAASAVVTIALFFFPAFVIRPFAYQAPRALLWAMAIRQWAPIATLFTGLLCFGLALAIWRIARIWGRIAVSILMLPVAFSVVMARTNYFEWMFHPVDNVRFEAPRESKVDPGEMIMAVRFGSDARAYPISQMAYHHIVNDIVGGVPVVVTY
jgi:Protein of unknown function (DUF3179)